MWWAVGLALFLVGFVKLCLWLQPKICRNCGIFATYGKEHSWQFWENRRGELGLYCTPCVARIESIEVSRGIPEWWT